MEANTFIDRLYDHNWERVGSGHYAEVFTKGRFAIKVVRNDNAYLEFARWARLASKQDPHLPKVLYINDKYWKTEGWFYVVMEPLKRMDYGRASEITTDGRNYMLSRRLISGGIADRWPRLNATLRTIGNRFGRTFGFDLHTSNIMQREDGTPVITDPIY